MERTFLSTLSMLQLNSRNRIYIVDAFYRRNTSSHSRSLRRWLLATGCRSKALAAACRSSCLSEGPSQRRPFAPIDLRAAVLKGATLVGILSHSDRLGTHHPRVRTPYYR